MIKGILSLSWVLIFPIFSFYQAFMDKTSFYHQKLNSDQKKELDHYMATFEKDPIPFISTWAGIEWGF